MGIEATAFAQFHFALLYSSRLLIYLKISHLNFFYFVYVFLMDILVF